MTDLKTQIQQVMNIEPIQLHPLHGGNIAQVYGVTLADGRKVAVKVGTPTSQLNLEAAMLQYLDQHSDLPVPEVLVSSESLLIMRFVEGHSTFSQYAEEHAADLLASLHNISAPTFGFDYDTLIGGLPQPNPQTTNWLTFFRDHRLLYMAGLLERDVQPKRGLLRRIETLAAKLDDLLPEPKFPALLHGDVWATNVLARGDRISAFLDPAIYYGHPEIELAFITLFNTFGPAFFTRYQEHHPLHPGFFTERRDIYNLYPLLVHVYLFGGSYVLAVDRILRRFGC